MHVNVLYPKKCGAAFNAFASNLNMFITECRYLFFDVLVSLDASICVPSLSSVLLLSALISLISLDSTVCLSVVFVDCSVPISAEDCDLSVVNELVVVLIPVFEVATVVFCIWICPIMVFSSRKGDERRPLASSVVGSGVASQEKAKKKNCAERKKSHWNDNTFS